MAKAKAKQALGIDIGGTGIKGALVDLDEGQLATERVRLLTPPQAKPEDVAVVVAELLDKIAVDGPVGMTLPAVITNGVARTAANIHKSWIGVNANELFAKATGRQVSVLNDADAAGMAEAKYGAGASRKGVVLVVTLGTGIGSALFVNGTLVPNSELGHLNLHKGDAEAWAADSVRESEDLSWKEYAGRLQDYFQLVQRLFWPELIIIGGGVSKKSEKFLPYIEVDAEVVPAQMQNEAGIIGAAMFAPQA